jgi:hypothetical protein
LGRPPVRPPGPLLNRCRPQYGRGRRPHHRPPGILHSAAPEVLPVHSVPGLPADSDGFGNNSVTTHLHNGHTPSESEGFRCYFFGRAPERALVPRPPHLPRTFTRACSDPTFCSTISIPATSPPASTSIRPVRRSHDVRRQSLRPEHRPDVLRSFQPRRHPRRPFVVNGKIQPFFEAPPAVTGCAGIERSRKDMTQLRHAETNTLFCRDFTGRYPMHCHNVVHEDRSATRTVGSASTTTRSGTRSF